MFLTPMVAAIMLFAAFVDSRRSHRHMRRTFWGGSRAPAHVHFYGDWAGDTWDANRDDAGAPHPTHVTRWRCRCGDVLEEQRPVNDGTLHGAWFSAQIDKRR